MVKMASEESFKEFIASMDEPAIIQDLRRECFDRISKARPMKFKHGLKILLKPEFDFDKIKPSSKTDMDRIIYIPPDKGIKHYTTENMDIEMYRNFVSSDWIRQPNKNDFFNWAFANDSLIIHIPANTVIHEPISIRSKINDTPLISNIFIYCEKNSSATVLIEKISEGNEKYISDNIRVICKDNSMVDLFSIQSLDNKAAVIQNILSKCYRDSSVNINALMTGSAYTKSNIISKLEDKGANSEIKALYLTREEQKYDIYAASLHNNKETKSDIVTKGVIFNKARALSRGLVRIESNAPQSNGYEKQDALLMSDEAEADAIPNLEINNDDVKCSHGSTVGMPDKEHIFYLMSRGLSKKDAEKSMILGYFEPLLVRFNNEELRENINNIIEKSIQNG